MVSSADDLYKQCGPISGSKLLDIDGIPDFFGKKTFLKKYQQMNKSMKNYPAYRVKQVWIRSLTLINCGSLNLCDFVFGTIFS